MTLGRGMLNVSSRLDIPWTSEKLNQHTQLRSFSRRFSQIRRFFVGRDRRIQSDVICTPDLRQENAHLRILVYSGP